MMQFLLLCAVLIGFSNFAQSETLRLSQPVASDANSETFGAIFANSLPLVYLSVLDKAPQIHLDNEFTLRAPIAKVCQKKGCFFIIQAENRVFRVSFKDYGFFIPTDSAGKQVVLNGRLVQKDLSPKQASHFQKDLESDTNSIRAGVVFEIVASSIQIPIA